MDVWSPVLSREKKSVFLFNFPAFGSLVMSSSGFICHCAPRVKGLTFLRDWKKGHKLWADWSCSDGGYFTISQGQSGGWEDGWGGWERARLLLHFLLFVSPFGNLWLEEALCVLFCTYSTALSFVYLTVLCFLGKTKRVIFYLPRFITCFSLPQICTRRRGAGWVIWATARIDLALAKVGLSGT